jgi:putative membrane protein insertion efficiency factor
MRLRKREGLLMRLDLRTLLERTASFCGPLPQQLLLTALRGYRLVLSPWLGTQCRFLPTCSVYAIGAIEGHGALAGSYLAARRVLRCHPWCDGGEDAVPAAPLRPLRLRGFTLRASELRDRAAQPTLPKIAP